MPLLNGANLIGVDLRKANLKYAYLIEADLRGAKLRGADLTCADLYNANLQGADLYNANLKGADLRYANLKGADLVNADLRNANLSNADLIDVKTDIFTLGYHLACPEEGSFTAYKKAGNCLVKLLVLEDAKRSSGTTPKCRCDKAKVLEIENLRTGLKGIQAISEYDDKFIYKVGEIVSVDNFDDNRWNECAPGIHFFMNRENAINY